MCENMSLSQSLCLSRVTINSLSIILIFLLPCNDDSSYNCTNVQFPEQRSLGGFPNLLDVTWRTIDYTTPQCTPGNVEGLAKLPRISIAQGFAVNQNESMNQNVCVFVVLSWMCFPWCDMSHSAARIDPTKRNSISFYFVQFVSNLLHKLDKIATFRSKSNPSNTNPV